MKILLLLSCVTFVSCSSTQSSNKAESEPESYQVLSRINGVSERPNWLNEEKPFEIKGGIVTSLGQTKIHGDDDVEAAYVIAENNAKTELCLTLESRLELIFQKADGGTTFDDKQISKIGAEACNLASPSIKIGSRYWEKLAKTTRTGKQKINFKVFSTVEMPEFEYKKAIADAAWKQLGKLALSAEFAKKVFDHWDEFLMPDK